MDGRYKLDIFQGDIHRVSKKYPTWCCPYLCQILTDFQHSFTCTLAGKLAINWFVNIPPNPNGVATLPCEILSLCSEKKTSTCVFFYTLCLQKRPTCSLSLSSPNINRFSKFFHKRIQRTLQTEVKAAAGAWLQLVLGRLEVRGSSGRRRRHFTADGHGTWARDCPATATGATANHSGRVANYVDAASTVGSPFGLLQQLLRLTVLRHRYVEHLFLQRFHATVSCITLFRIYL